MVDISSLPYNRSGRNNTGKTAVYGSTGILIPNPSLSPNESRFTYVDKKDAVSSKYSPTGYFVNPTSNRKINGKSTLKTSANGLFVNKSTSYDPLGSCKPTQSQLDAAKKKVTPTTATPPSINTKQPEYTNPLDWSWNLPPHRWSMPLVRTYDGTSETSSNDTKPKSDMYRRGRIWWKMSDDSLLLKTGGNDNTISPNNKENRKFGFQFLWNPEAFNTTVAVQMDVTPTAQDRFLGGAGFFPATQGITFNITLDRTNDFACAARLFEGTEPNVNGVSNLTIPATSHIPIDKVRDLKKWYQHGGSFSSDKATSAAIDEKLVDLFSRGTIADLEFLYKAINGIGPGGSLDNQWINGRGIATADIGFLTPTLLNIDIGPLSYAGYVNNLSITHKYFTPDMVPIRTDVVISLQLLATAGLTDLNTANANVINNQEQAAANRGGTQPR
jgi:hypothetical protein